MIVYWILAFARMTMAIFAVMPADAGIQSMRVFLDLLHQNVSVSSV
jgi:hypothetical protein